MLKTWILIAFLIFLPISKADVISINSGGSQEAVILPNEYIEGFFFTNPLTAQEPEPEPSSGRKLDFGSICNYSERFIIENLKGDNLSYSEVELVVLKGKIIKDLQIYVTEDKLAEILQSCPKINVKSKFPWWIVLIMVFGMVIITYQNRNSYYISIITKRLKSLRKKGRKKIEDKLPEVSED